VPPRLVIPIVGAAVVLALLALRVRRAVFGSDAEVDRPAPDRQMVGVGPDQG